VTPFEFSQQISEVTHAILDQLGAEPPTTMPPVPKDWPELRATVRRVAEELILCADVKEGIALLRQDQGALQGVVILTTEMIPFSARKLAIQRAYAATSHEPSVLPFHAFCSFLIELCDGLELGSPNEGA
jgi:hypothetical protein